MFVIYVLVQESAMIGESREIPEHVSTMLTLVNLVPPVGLYVSPEVVPTSITTSTDVTSKRLLPRVDPHVSTKVSGPDKLSTAHLTRVRPLGFWDSSAFPFTAVLLS